MGAQHAHMLYMGMVSSFVSLSVSPSLRMGTAGLVICAGTERLFVWCRICGVLCAAASGWFCLCKVLVRQWLGGEAFPLFWVLADMVAQLLGGHRESSCVLWVCKADTCSRHAVTVYCFLIRCWFICCCHCCRSQAVSAPGVDQLATQSGLPNSLLSCSLLCQHGCQQGCQSVGYVLRLS